MFKTRYLFLALLYTGNVSADISLYQNCIFNLLAQSCVITSDKDAPPFMIEEGAAACFVGSDLAPKDDQKISGFYQGIIYKNGLLRKKYGPEIKKTTKCVSGPDELKRCKLAVTAGGGLEKIKACRKFLISPDLNLRKTSSGIQSDFYQFELPRGWKLVDDKIGGDSRKFVFRKKDNRIVQLTISEELNRDKYDTAKEKLKKGISTIWNSNSMKSLRHKVVTVGIHKSIDEHIGANTGGQFTIAMYYLYGEKRIAILSFTELGTNKKIENLSRPIIKKFLWGKN